MSSTQFPDFPAARAVVEGNVCSICGSDLVVREEETTYEPRSVVYVCTDHRDHGSGDCPGTVVTVYGDGHITRTVYGRGTVPIARPDGFPDTS
ncbi:MAG: hypothetical protein R3324_13880 [Halobacteriales archaeon]|nr:hypothetical protein [Halobacteriales archaeon]